MDPFPSLPYRSVPRSAGPFFFFFFFFSLSKKEILSSFSTAAFFVANEQHVRSSTHSLKCSGSFVFSFQVADRFSDIRFGRIRLYHPRIYTSPSRLCWLFSAGTEFRRNKTLWICHPALRLYRQPCGCLRDTFPGSHSRTCWPTQAIVFHSRKMAPTKRTSLTWKEQVVMPDELQLLKQHGTRQRSAAERLDIIEFDCFCSIQSAFRRRIGPHRFLSSSRLHQPLKSGPWVDDTTEFYCTAIFTEFYLVC